MSLCQLSCRFFVKKLISYSSCQILYTRIWVSDSCDDGRLWQRVFENHLPVIFFRRRWGGREMFSVCWNITCPRSSDSAGWLETCGCFLNLVFTTFTATPWGLTATVASLYRQHWCIFTWCQVDANILPRLQILAWLKCSQTMGRGGGGYWLDL